MPSLLLPSRINFPIFFRCVKSRSTVRLFTDIYTDIYTDICRIIFVEPVLMIYLYIIDNQTNIQYHTFRHVPTFIPTFIPTFTPTLVGSGEDNALF